MSDELISEYIDPAAIKAQTDFFVSELERVKISYDTLSKLRLNIQGSNSLPELNANIKAAEKATDALKVSQDALNRSKLLETQLQNELLKQKALVDAATRREITANTTNQKVTADLGNEYKMLGKAVAEANQRYYNLALTQGRSSPLAKQALTDAIQLKQVQNQLNEDTLIYTHNVGNYSSAFTNYANVLRGLRGPTKLLGEALGIGAVEADQFRIVIEHSLQGIAAYFRAKENGASTHTALTAAQLAENEAIAQNTEELLTNAAAQLNYVELQEEAAAAIQAEVVALEEQSAAIIELTLASGGLITEKEAYIAIVGEEAASMQLEVAAAEELSLATAGLITVEQALATITQEAAIAQAELSSAVIANTILTNGAVAAQAAETAAVISTNVAMKAFKITLASLGVAEVATALVAVIYGLYKVVDALDSVSEKQKILNEVNEASVKGFGEQVAIIDILKVKLNDISISQSDRVKYVEEYNKVASEGNKIDEKQIDNLDIVNAQIEKQIELLRTRAIAKAAENIIAKKAEDLLDAQIKLSEAEAASPTINADALKAATDKGVELIIESAKRRGVALKTSADEILLISQQDDEALAQTIKNNSDKFSILNDSLLKQQLKAVNARINLIRTARAGERGGTGPLNFAIANVDKAQKELDKYLAVISGLINPLSFVPDKTKKEAAEKSGQQTLQELVKNLDLQFAAYKRQQDRVIKSYLDTANGIKDSGRLTDLTYDERINALQNYTNAVKALNDKQAQEDIRAKEEESARAIEHLEEQKKDKADELKVVNDNLAKATTQPDKDNLQAKASGITSQIGRLSTNQAIIAKNTAKEVADIKAQARDKDLTAEQEFQTKFNDITKQFYDKRTVEIKAQNDKQVKEITDSADKKVAVMEGTYTDQLQVINQSYVDGKISLQKYNREVEKLDRGRAETSLKIAIEAAEDILHVHETQGLNVAKELAALAKLKADLTKLTNKDSQDNGSSTLDFIDKLVDKYNQVKDIVTGALDAAATKRKNDIQDEIDLIDKRKDADLAANDARIQSDQDKAANALLINARADAQKDQLAKRQKQIDIDNAKAQKALAIFTITLSTAQAVIKAYTEGDPYTKVARAILAGVVGAAQLAVAIATPIPKFFLGKGAGNNYEGPGMVNDHPNGFTKEVIEHADGTFDFPQGRNVITHIKRDDIIHPDENAWRMATVRAANRDVTARMKLPAAPAEDLVATQLNAHTKLLQQIANKKELQLGSSDAGMVALWRHGSNTTKYIQENTQW